jgi:PEGA domain
MAIAQPRAPRHILYIVSALALSAALAACAEPDADERRADQRASGSDRSPAPRANDSSAPTAPAAAPSQPASTGSSTGPLTGQPAAPSTSTHPSASQPATTDPETGFHLDDPEVEYEIPRRGSRPRKGRTIQIVLRSSPPGAVAAVDGVAVGPTPTLWEGTVDATPREFTFVLPGYAIARYRFVPTRNGIVHGTLEPIKAEGEEGDPRDRRRPPGPAQAPPPPAR